MKDSEGKENLPLRLDEPEETTGVGSDEFPFGFRPPAWCELLALGSVVRNEFKKNMYNQSPDVEKSIQTFKLTALS